MTLKQFTIYNYPSVDGNRVSKMVVPGGNVNVKAQSTQIDVAKEISREF